MIWCWEPGLRINSFHFSVFAKQGTSCLIRETTGTGTGTWNDGDDHCQNSGCFFLGYY